MSFEAKHFSIYVINLNLKQQLANKHFKLQLIDVYLMRAPICLRKLRQVFCLKPVTDLDQHLLLYSSVIVLVACTR